MFEALVFFLISQVIIDEHFGQPKWKSPGLKQKSTFLTRTWIQVSNVCVTDNKLTLWKKQVPTLTTRIALSYSWDTLYENNKFIVRQILCY